MFFTYILYCKTFDKYYVGSTSNIEDRLKRHNEHRNKYTKFGDHWDLVYCKIYESKSEAYQAELYIKSRKSRQYIEKLISSVGSEHSV